MFEPGSAVKGEVVYLTPGSFFGEIPFSKTRQTGYIKAVTNSTIMLINTRQIYRIFLSASKGLKGYVKNLKKNGFDIIDSGSDFLKYGGKVIAVFSPYHNSGNSFFSAILGLILSEHGSTIILDASYNGNSIFNMFEQVKPPALSQMPENKTGDRDVSNYIIDIGENFSLLNISSGSKVKVNSSILSPIIFMLSGKYKYIIIDHSDYEKTFTDAVLGASDMVFSVIKNIKDRSIYPFYDSALKEGQSLFYILNRYYAKGVGLFEGGYMLEKLDVKKSKDFMTDLKKHITADNKQKIFDELPGLITRERTALVVETNLVNSVYLSGFFSTLYEKDIKIDFIYASSWSYIIAALFVLSNDQQDFEKKFLKLFTEDKINSFLDITFPEEHIYKNNKIMNYASELAGNSRLEHYSVLPAAKLSDLANGQRIFSTGYGREILAASFAFDLFEPVKIADGLYHSGYPASVKPEDLFRTDIKEIRTVSINKQPVRFSEKKLFKFFKGYIDGLERNYSCPAFPISANDFIIKTDFAEYNPKEILKISKDICKDMK